MASQHHPYVCVYVDSNIFIEAKRLAEVRNGSPGARFHVRIDYDKLLCLCKADRPLKAAHACGSVPPELNNLWARLTAQGVRVSLFKREEGEGEKCVPDLLLQMAMYGPRTTQAPRNCGSCDREWCSGEVRRRIWLMGGGAWRCFPGNIV